MKIKHLKSKAKLYQTKLFFCDDEFKPCLGFLHRFRFTVTIDKGSNDYALICKRFTSIVFLPKLEYLVILTPKLIQK